MNISEYQKWADENWHSKGQLRQFMDQRDYFIMTAGLGGETGEVLEVLKKDVRDGKFDKENLTKELGDVLYYLTMIASYHSISMQEVIDKNVKKLEDRRSRNVIHGSGNDR
jgi:NTP pyrophosphatase (non-canonical NTP hydrolase)